MLSRSTKLSNKPLIETNEETNLTETPPRPLIPNPFYYLKKHWGKAIAFSLGYLANQPTCSVHDLQSTNSTNQLAPNNSDLINFNSTCSCQETVLETSPILKQTEEQILSYKGSKSKNIHKKSNPKRPSVTLAKYKELEQKHNATLTQLEKTELARDKLNTTLTEKDLLIAIPQTNLTTLELERDKVVRERDNRPNITLTEYDNLVKQINNLTTEYDDYRKIYKFNETDLQNALQANDQTITEKEIETATLINTETQTATETKTVAETQNITLPVETITHQKTTTLTKTLPAETATKYETLTDTLTSTETHYQSLTETETTTQEITQTKTLTPPTITSVETETKTVAPTNLPLDWKNKIDSLSKLEDENAKLVKRPNITAEEFAKYKSPALVDELEKSIRKEYQDFINPTNQEKIITIARQVGLINPNNDTELLTANLVKKSEHETLVNKLNQIEIEKKGLQETNKQKEIQLKELKTQQTKSQEKESDTLWNIFHCLTNAVSAGVGYKLDEHVCSKCSHNDYDELLDKERKIVEQLNRELKLGLTKLDLGQAINKIKELILPPIDLIDNASDLKSLSARVSQQLTSHNESNKQKAVQEVKTSRYTERFIWISLLVISLMVIELTKQLLTKLRKYEELSKEQRQLGGKLRELNKNGVIELLNDNKKKLQDEIEEDPSYRCAIKESEERIACAGCQFKYPKSEMLEKEVKGDTINGGGIIDGTFGRAKRLIVKRSKSLLELKAECEDLKNLKNRNLGGKKGDREKIIAMVKDYSQRGTERIVYRTIENDDPLKDANIVVIERLTNANQQALEDLDKKNVEIEQLKGNITVLEAELKNEQENNQGLVGNINRINEEIVATKQELEQSIAREELSKNNDNITEAVKQIRGLGWRLGTLPRNGFANHYHELFNLVNNLGLILEDHIKIDRVKLQTLQALIGEPGQNALKKKDEKITDLKEKLEQAQTIIANVERRFKLPDLTKNALPTIPHYTNGLQTVLNLHNTMARALNILGITGYSEGQVINGKASKTEEVIAEANRLKNIEIQFTKIKDKGIQSGEDYLIDANDQVNEEVLNSLKKDLTEQGLELFVIQNGLGDKLFDKDEDDNIHLNATKLAQVHNYLNQLETINEELELFNEDGTINNEHYQKINEALIQTHTLQEELFVEVNQDILNEERTAIDYTKLGQVIEKAQALPL
ncbi:11825_t:CDS:10 [Funneliformis geosporum]|nr:11825_t:CDS:10 [Funneliformis geosporum]